LPESDDEVRRLPTLAVDGPWLLKREVAGEMRLWVHEFHSMRDMRRDSWVNDEWVVTSYRTNGKWENIICQ